MESNEIQKRLGENVKKIRKQQKLTQSQLAEKAEISEETLKNIELSRCWTSDKNLAKLTKALNIDISKLFLPTEFSFKEESEDTKEIKKMISKNLHAYVESVFTEIAK